uniref:Ankyrin repeat and MYND domain containing 2a n=2 Tax=Eptatretus burgeri TaxID=7764 RepID=A0A8C4PZ72_EPTBU
MVLTKKGDLVEEERELLTNVSQGNVEEVERLLKLKNVRINCLDEHGMSPLMHAAYKGRANVCEVLLKHAADVNVNEHEHGYTTLMFAGLSGNKKITRMMLDAGAKTDMVNSVGRTAAQMAAFVGQHECVTIINNYFPRERLEYYTHPQGLETEPKLPPELADQLHRILLATNLNPVKLVQLVQADSALQDPSALTRCVRVLNSVSEHGMKEAEPCETLAIRSHYLGCILNRCCLHLQEKGSLTTLIKGFLKGREGDGFPLMQERFIRDAIKRFPRPEAGLLQQLVRTIAPIEMGHEPTALSVLTQAVTGQVGMLDAEVCATCGEYGALCRCSACKRVVYCGTSCQKLHWFTHKLLCASLNAERLREQEHNLHKNAGLEAVEKKEDVGKTVIIDPVDEPNAVKEESDGKTKENQENQNTRESTGSDTLAGTRAEEISQKVVDGFG